jgi:hypothetical protein
MFTRALVAIALGGCAAHAPPAADDDDDGSLPTGDDDGKADSAGADWTDIGLGVAYQRVNAGDGVVIAYGGYSAKLSYSAAWVLELVDQRLGAAGVGHVYAVQGPRDPGYDAREIGNSKLRRHLATLGTDAPIFVVAHSSGSYVAHELLDQLEAGGATDVLARIGYADLDGGGAGLTDTIAETLRKLVFVYAHDPTLSSGYSENHSSATALGEEFAPHATTFEVTVPSTGCHDGAGWCLHDVLITHRPHNPDHYDLARDYTDFVDRPITIEYIDAIAP